MVKKNPRKSATKATAAPLSKPVKDEVLLEERIVNNPPIVNKIVDDAIVDQVIEKKHIEVHKQDLVTEIHEQPIIEIHEKPVTQVIQEKTLFNKLTNDTVLEEIEAPAMSEDELVTNTEQLIGNIETLKIQEKYVDQLEEKELIKKIEIQPVVELHEQPRITEIHEQKVVEVIETPVVRVIHEKPIVKRFVDAPSEETKIKTTLKAIKTEEFKQEQQEIEGLSFAQRLEKEKNVQFREMSTL